MNYARLNLLRTAPLALALGLAAASLGCSSVSDFEGMWTATSASANDSCSGSFDTKDPQFTMRLREGKDSDLEFVSLDSKDLTHETCVQKFSVDGDTATLDGTQPCSIPTEGVDAMGKAFSGTLVQSYTDDHLKLDGDTLEESGHLTYVKADSACSSAFSTSYVRLKD